MTATEKTERLRERLNRAGIDATADQANTLRKAEMTLQRWGEAECGDSNPHASYSIERDEKTGKPYRCVYPHDSNDVRRYPVPDREKRALRRVAAVCKELGIHFYHQTDPRGCTLYVGKNELTASGYSSQSISCCV